MAQLALILTFGFIACAYVRESKRRGEASPAVWIATLWMMRCGSRGIETWTAGSVTEEAAANGGAGIDQAFLFIVSLLGFVVLAQRWPKVKKVLGHNIPVVALFGYMTLSIAWSQSQFDSMKQLYRGFGDLAMVLLIVTEARPLEAMLTMFRRGLILLIPLSVVVAKYFPDLGRMHEKHGAPDSWIGVTTHKNCLGQLCFLAGVVFLIEIVRNMRRRKISIWAVPMRMPFETIYIGMTLYLLNGGSERSSTSILALAIAVGLSFFLERFRARPRLARKVLLGIVCAIVFLNVVTSFFGGSLSSLVASTQGKDPTLAGRTYLWEDIMAVANHPLLGAGYMGFWTPAMKAYFKAIPRDSWGPAQAHNGYIETYIQLGWVGILLLALLVLHGFVRATKALAFDFDYARFRLALLLTALLQNMTEAGFPRPTQIVWFTFLLVVVDPLVRRPIRSKNPAEKQDELIQLHRTKEPLSSRQVLT